MINKVSLKRNIFSRLSQEQFDSNIDRLITGCLIFKAITVITSKNSSFISQTSGLIDSYITTYKGLVLEAKDKYVSYSEMRRYIENRNFKSFLEFSEKNIEEINTLFEDKTEIVDFSLFTFSQYMYKIEKISLNQRKRLSEIHFSVMAPIAKYFYEINNIAPSALEIADALSVEGNPGKVIRFSVAGVTPSNIAKKIRSNAIAIEDYIHDVKVVGDLVEILVK